MCCSPRAPPRAAAALCRPGGALGIGLAAIYLLPAMELQPWISAHELWTSFYRASNWFVMAPERWVDPDTMRVIGSIVLAAALLAAGLCLALLQLPDGQERRELGFWVALGLACLILIAGLLPWFWDLPLVGKVQFPWRLLMVVEFALLTALCLAPLGELRRVVVYVFAAGGRRPGAGRDADRDRCVGAHRVRVAHRRARPARRQGIPARRLQARRLALRRSRAGAAQGHAGDLLHAGRPDVPRRQRALSAPCALRSPPISRPRSRCAASSSRPGASMPACRSPPASRCAWSPSPRPAGETVTRLDRGAPPIERWGQAISGVSLLLLLALVIRSSARG